MLPGVSKASKIVKLFITDGTNERLTGQCLFFTRISTETVLTEANIHNVSDVYSH